MQYDVIQKVSREFEKWIGYCEKEKLKTIGIDYTSPENYTIGAGDKNMTIFAKVYKEKTGIDIQGQPWCDCFVDVVFIHLFGVDMAKKLLGGFSAYTPTSANMFKQIKRWTTEAPKEGYIGFFKNDVRIYHTFYVRDFKNNLMTTIEGNTSGLAGVVENGGLVAKKNYNYTGYKPRIPGFGTPDYSLVATYEEGWLKAADNVRWWYQRSDGSYPYNKWCLINKHWYLFDKNGYMLTGLHRWNGKDVNPEDNSGEWYLLEPNPNSDFEGACYHEVDAKNGGLVLWEVDLPNSI